MLAPASCKALLLVMPLTDGLTYFITFLDIVTATRTYS